MLSDIDGAFSVSAPAFSATCPPAAGSSTGRLNVLVSPGVLIEQALDGGHAGEARVIGGPLRLGQVAILLLRRRHQALRLSEQAGVLLAHRGEAFAGLLRRRTGGDTGSGGRRGRGNAALIE